MFDRQCSIGNVRSAMFDRDPALLSVDMGKPGAVRSGDRCGGDEKSGSGGRAGHGQIELDHVDHAEHHQPRQQGKNKNTGNTILFGHCTIRDDFASAAPSVHPDLCKYYASLVNPAFSAGIYG
jgi:hypothetical protein